MYCNFLELEKQIKEFQEKREALNKANANESTDKVFIFVWIESMRLYKSWCALNKVIFTFYFVDKLSVEYCYYAYQWIHYFCFSYQQIGFGSTGLYDGDIYDGPSNKLV